MVEKFSIAEVAALRGGLLHGGLDSFQVAEIIKTFIAGHGYGISTETALSAVGRLEATRRDVGSFHRELESLALVM
ncbi:MAG TPA: hypothetical protein VKY85_25785 [Candidatus Angelobacter sp.]|jgi:hypothetical protein|nr:hypothetical protein [Candidatus Angelobacter sp.]